MSISTWRVKGISWRCPREERGGGFSYCNWRLPSRVVEYREWRGHDWRYRHQSYSLRATQSVTLRDSFMTLRRMRWELQIWLNWNDKGSFDELSNERADESKHQFSYNWKKKILRYRRRNLEWSHYSSTSLMNIIDKTTSKSVSKHRLSESNVYTLSLKIEFLDRVIIFSSHLDYDYHFSLPSILRSIPQKWSYTVAVDMLRIILRMFRVNRVTISMSRIDVIP